MKCFLKIIISFVLIFHFLTEKNRRKDHHYSNVISLLHEEDKDWFGQLPRNPPHCGPLSVTLNHVLLSFLCVFTFFSVGFEMKVHMHEASAASALLFIWKCRARQHHRQLFSPSRLWKKEKRKKKSHVFEGGSQRKLEHSNNKVIFQINNTVSDLQVKWSFPKQSLCWCEARKCEWDIAFSCREDLSEHTKVCLSKSKTLWPKPKIVALVVTGEMPGTVGALVQNIQTSKAFVLIGTVTATHPVTLQAAVLLTYSTRQLESHSSLSSTSRCLSLSHKSLPLSQLSMT